MCRTMNGTNPNTMKGLLNDMYEVWPKKKCYLLQGRTGDTVIWHLMPWEMWLQKYPYNRRHAPSSTLNSSVMEMTRWAMANLNRGELDGQKILKDESYDILWTNSVENSDKAKVGLIWFLGEYKGNLTVSHGGDDTGYWKSSWITHSCPERCSANNDPLEIKPAGQSW